MGPFFSRVDLQLERLARDTLDLTVSVAGDARSKGETAGHSQVSIWRN